MTNSQPNSDDCTRPSRIGTAGLLVWMLGLMLLGWFVLDGPVLCSIVKRVAPLQRAQHVLRCALGEPAEAASVSDGNPQP